MPDEETQYLAYDAVLRWAGKRPVTIRTFDAGGDKPVPGFTQDGEANPFLGVRGLRLCLARPTFSPFSFARSLVPRCTGNLKVMFPMVTNPEELEAARKLFADVVARLQAEGIAAKLPELGIMVEVPAAALAIERFERRVFLDRLERSCAICHWPATAPTGRLAKLIDPLHPAVLELIAAPRSTAGAQASASVFAATWRAIRAAFRRSCLAACASFRSILRLWRRSSRRIEGLSRGGRRELRRRSRKPAKPARLPTTSAYSRKCWTVGRRACGCGSRTRWARTAASSARFRIRPIRFRFRSSTSTRSSRSAISRRRPRPHSLRAYARAHPRRIGRLTEGPHERTMTLHLPDLGSSKRNAQLDALLQEFARRLIAILHGGEIARDVRWGRGA